MFPQRPSSKDNEEDLLAFQDSFLESGEKPSANVVKCSRKSNTNKKQFGKDFIKLQNSDISHQWTKPDEMSKFVRVAGGQSIETSGKKEDEDMMIEMDKYDTHVTKVLSNVIKERNVSEKPILFPSFQNHAFPPSFKCKKRFTGVKKSLFAQQFQDENIKKELCNHSASKSKSLEERISELNVQEMLPHARLNSRDGLKPMSTIESPSVDLDCQIHKENIKKIAEMTEEEILQEQQKIQSMLNPATIDFLKHKKEQKTVVKKESIKSKAEIPALNDTHKCDMQLCEGSEQLIKEKSKWVGMENVEDEKMNWMKLFDHTNNNLIDHSLRFDFEGKLLSFDESQSVPTYVGLHHHGEESDLAGYTLQELLTMVRSEFMQQRVIALKVLGRIICKDRRCDYKVSTNCSFLTLLLDAGFAFLLRWALDDKSYICIQAAIEVLFSLLSTTEAQTKFLDANFLSHRGLEIPCFQLYNLSKKLETLELLQKDLILGLLSMNLLPRIRYIIEVCNPDTQMKMKCFQILQRISSHSVDASLKVLDCPRLIQFFVDTCIRNPVKESFSDLKQFDILPYVTRILVNIALSGRHACMRLFQHYESIYKLVVKFVAEVGGYAGKEGGDNELESNILDTELNMWKLWIICLSYGQMLDLFRDMGTQVLLQLQACNTILNGKYSITQLEWVKHVLKLVLSAAYNLQSKDVAFGGYIEIVTTIAKDACDALQICKNNHTKKCLFGVLSIALDVFAIYCNKLHQHSAINAVQLATFVETAALPVVQIQRFISEQNICWSSSPGASDGCSHPFLPDLQLNNFSESATDTMLEFVAVQMLFSSYLRCCFIMAKCSRSVCPTFMPFLKIIPSKFTTKFSQTTNWYLNRHATYSMYWAVKLFVISLPHVKDLDQFTSQYHFVTLQCFSLLGSGDEFFAYDLLSSVLFHKELISEDKQNLAASFKVEELPTVQSSYMFCFTIPETILANSKFRCTTDPLSITTFFVPYHPSPLIPMDWIFLPIIQTYDATLQRFTNDGYRGESDPSRMPHVLRTTQVTLKFILFVEKSNPNYMTHLRVEVKLVRLMCVFLSGSDIFLDPTVHELLSTLFGFYCSKCQALDFDTPIPGLSSFNDFYTSLLEQFEAVSYGDKLFSSVLLLPLIQSCSSKYKLALWSQHRDSLRLITLNTEQTLFSQRAYLQPLERSTQVLYAYIHAIAAGCCQHERNPFIYQTAIHHVASFIFQRPLLTDTDARRKMLKLVESAQDNLKVFKKHVLQYDISADPPKRFDSSDTLSAFNETVLTYLKS